MLSIASANPKAVEFDFRSFVVPVCHARSLVDYERTNVCAIVPTYAPDNLTERLVQDLTQWNPTLSVYVVDDSTPQRRPDTASVFERIASISRRITVLRTPHNSLKAGALNYALRHILREQSEFVPDVILTADDDVVIQPTTIKNLTCELMSSDMLGAVCSQCHVLNKNKNILTRLQGLEYLGFNAIRLADEGFLSGPLVMHGMLTAFRAAALREIGGFAEKHLIEDYEVTMQLKARGWVVKSAVNSHAWTLVPESLPKLWRQRTRWSYGGITVVDGTRRLSSVFQDIVGHGTFWATVIMIDALIIGILLKSGGYVAPLVPALIISISLLQFAVGYVFQLWLMRLYRESDKYDWLIRMSVLPEFIYYNVLTIAQVGSYLFLFFNTLKSTVAKQGSPGAARAIRHISALFRACGYTKSWGTRVN